MKTKNKILLTLLAVVIGTAFAIIGNIIFNFREYGVKSIEDKATVLSQTVKHALTSQMLSGVIDDRELFLSQLKTLPHVDDIWLSRGKSVILQYGNGKNDELSRDKIDKEVLRTSLIKREIKDNLFERNSFRITIPYIATKKGTINCMQCHLAKEGETLGAISIVMNIDDAKAFGIKTVLNTTIITLLLIVLIFIFINKLVSPFLNIFDSIKRVMNLAQQGDYSARIEQTDSVESKAVAKWINNLLEKLQITLEDIDSNINIFMVKDKDESTDPLLKVKNSVLRLSEIYKYRETIQHDQNLEQIYRRLAHVLKTIFKLDDFNIYEADTITGNVTLIHKEIGIHCSADEYGCRADRTNTIIDSCQFTNVCSNFHNISKDFTYICIPYSISNELDLIITIIGHSKEEDTHIRNISHLIKDYIETSKTEIISKKLMAQLEKTASTDALTGLYNRKFLEDSTQVIAAQATRANVDYGVLMLDIDHFKKVNDTFGHDVGDQAIRLLAQTLRENTRTSDTLVRYGGEEFVILLYNCKEENIELIAQKIRTSFSQVEIPAGTSTISKTISIGTSMFPKDSDDIWQCIKFADISLYKAKNSGRNKVVSYKKEKKVL